MAKSYLIKHNLLFGSLQESSYWQSFFSIYYFCFYFFAFKPKKGASFDMLFISYSFKKFLVNFSLLYNFSNVFQKMLNVFVQLGKKHNIKGCFLLYYFLYNSLFFSFIELTNVRVAGRSLKVPNPIMFNRSYRVGPKVLSQFLTKTKGQAFDQAFKHELVLTDQNNGFFINYEQNQIKELINNRMFSHYRWKYRQRSSAMSRSNP